MAGDRGGKLPDELSYTSHDSGAGPIPRAATPYLTDPRSRVNSCPQTHTHGVPSDLHYVVAHTLSSKNTPTRMQTGDNEAVLHTAGPQAINQLLSRSSHQRQLGRGRCPSLVLSSVVRAWSSLLLSFSLCSCRACADQRHAGSVAFFGEMQSSAVFGSSLMHYPGLPRATRAHDRLYAAVASVARIFSPLAPAEGGARLISPADSPWLGTSQSALKRGPPTVALPRGTRPSRSSDLTTGLAARVVSHGMRHRNQPAQRQFNQRATGSLVSVGCGHADSAHTATRRLHQSARYSPLTCRAPVRPSGRIPTPRTRCVPRWRCPSRPWALRGRDRNSAR